MMVGTSASELDYDPCRYGACGTAFRGPAAAVDEPHVAVIGGSETYGKYVERPFPDRLGDLTGWPVANLGVMNAGLDVFVGDDAFLETASRAQVVVIQTLGAHALSNRFYTVHPRRNDRFLTQGAPLSTLYPEVDFTQFAFARHMLVTLRTVCPVRFETVAAELRQAWIARMRHLASRLQGRCVVLHLRIGRDRGLGAEPVLVSAEMLDALADHVAEVVTCDVGTRMGAGDGTVAEAERAVAACLPNADAHGIIAVALFRAVGRRDGLAA